MSKVPQPNAASYLAIPEELRARPQWLAWMSVVGVGKPAKLPNGKFTSKPLKEQKKPHKLPINPRTGGLASTTNSATWGSFGEAVAAANKWSLTGIGFVFSASDPYTGVDLDDCRDPKTGQIADWGWEIIRPLDSYTEVSPNGTGVHIIVVGCLAGKQGNQTPHHGGKVEMFSRARYFTFTGERLPSTPDAIGNRQDPLLALHSRIFAQRQKVATQPTEEVPLSVASDRELLDKAFRAKNALNFRALWEGRWEGMYTSQSEADAGLCCHLAFWTGKDAARMASLFRQSGLMRDKWDRPDYLERTINYAISQTRNTYMPGRRRTLKIATAPRTQQGDDNSAHQQIGEVPDLRYFPYTDTGNAERLVKLHGSDIRYCTEMQKWLVWDGRRWAVDSRQHIKLKRLFKKTIRELHKQAADIDDKDQRTSAERHARQSESVQRINAVLECAQAEDGIAISATALDSHVYLLNCLNGTLDLHAGRLREHDQKDLLTKLVHVNYRADAACPQFLRFLHRIMGENLEAEPTDRAERLVGFLRKCFGSALTDDVSDKAIFCFFGGGNNGKTTLLEILRFILIEYSAQILIDSLMAHKSRESSTSTADLADLRGARFVTTSETEEGQRLALAKLKYLTQGMGEIKACRKYENPIIFTATHKLFLDANHKPAIRGAETAVWNRLKPIPFLITIPPEEIDKGLLNKLKTELEGILAWLVEGCRIWRSEGLGNLAEVAEASATWQAESDRFREFFDELFEIRADAWVPVPVPWRTYRIWCADNNEETLTKAAFDTKLREVGCKKASREGGKVRVWTGIRARDDAEDTSAASDKVTIRDPKR